MKSATKKESLNGVVKGAATLVAISVVPFGSLSISGREARVKRGLA